jgi:glucosamine--fructose-6-phosphate aminotransferase (isomerizing)
LPTLDVARAYLAIDAVLDAVDRLEVRGRDSAGVELWITLDEADAAALPGSLHERADAQYRHRAVSFFRRGLCLVYKRASVIGRLGENVVFLRDAIAADDELHAVLALPSARVTVLAHTRWASVGRITEANAHPVDSRQVAGEGIEFGYATAVLNGDIDNHLDLRKQFTMPSDPTGISTDAKVIPVMLAHLGRTGQEPRLALAECLRRYHGSVAIAASVTTRRTNSCSRSRAVARLCRLCGRLFPCCERGVRPRQLD